MEDEGRCGAGEAVTTMPPEVEVHHLTPIASTLPQSDRRAFDALSWCRALSRARNQNAFRWILRTRHLAPASLDALK